MNKHAPALLLPALLAAARAQQIVVQDGEVVFAEGLIDFSGMVAGEVMGGGEQAADGAAQPTERQKRLQRLEFDRRPSAILSAWAKPAAEPPEEPPPFDEPEPSAATTAAAEMPPESATEAAREGAAPGVAEAPREPEPGGTETTIEADTPGAGEAVRSESAVTAESPGTAETAGGAARESAVAELEGAKQAWSARKKESEAARKEYEAERIDWEMARLQRDVSIGDWRAVREAFSSFTEAEGEAGFGRMLESLAQGPPQKEQVPPQGQRYREKNQFSPADVVGMLECAPLEPSREHLAKLGTILQQALEAGHQLEAFLSALEPRLAASGESTADADAEQRPALDRREVALIVAGAGREGALGGLLPSPEVAEQENDREALNLLSRHFLAKHAEEGKTEWLERAWRSTQAVLAVGAVDEQEKSQAIQRAVEIAPKIRAELGQAWLDESFTERPERGMEILAAIGAESSRALSMRPMESDGRFRLLELQTTMADTLLAAAPELAGEWSAQLELLGANWLREARLSWELDDSTALGPRMQRDVFGNYFYFDSRSFNRGNVPEPIRSWRLLDIRPGDAWLERLADTFRPELQAMYARLLLKVGEEVPAFPYIEQLAASLPSRAEELVDEFLRVWTRNHDPDSDSNRASRYNYFYGYDQRADGIPLTRSKQERNLSELAEWVARLRALPVELDDELLATAFETAHSNAEVYRLEAIERIFGSMGALEPGTLAGLLQTMRTNLVGVWRDPALQKEKRTGRRQQDIQAEVDRGYELAGATLERALEERPSSWELWLAKASLLHDHNNYRSELAKDSQFADRRQAAFELFARAAQLYAASLEGLEQDDESVAVYDTWFYAALGACDLDAVAPYMQLAEPQVALIRSAIAALPEGRRGRHLDMFSSNLFSRMSSVNPAVKFRYVRAGLEIAGDNQLVREARSVFEYYQDLVTEIRLETRVDGSSRVGHGEPFGLLVDIRHTREIERESGGFSKYLQNQQNQSFGYNYGRPLENYREKFEEGARGRLDEHFEVLSVTFNEPDAGSRAEAEYGWRVTPYAYLLLRARGPEVDRVPALSLDLDFLDTSGYAVLPIESAALPIDAADAVADERPWAELRLTQTLDERRSEEGKLLLELKASAHGLPPDFAALLELESEGFEVGEIADHGVSVVQIHESGHGVLAERSWTVAMQAEPELERSPTRFSFARPRVETASLEQYRFEDADLIAVGPTVELVERWGEEGSGSTLRVILGLLALVAAGVLGRRLLARPRATVEARFSLPERLTPFTVIGLLRDIAEGDGLSADDHAALRQEISSLERHYFVEEQARTCDLRAIAESWIGRAT